MRIQTHTTQLALFDLPSQNSELTPKLSLPFQVTNTIDVNRARKIFHVTGRTVTRMIKRKLLRAYRPPGRATAYRIEYDSVVAYCDRLRIHNGISDSRSPLRGGRRRRDQDLLPFSMEDTISVAAVSEILDCAPATVHPLIESGILVAYQVLIQQTGCPWRIFRPSLQKYLESLHQMADVKTSSQGKHPVRQ